MSKFGKSLYMESKREAKHIRKVYRYDPKPMRKIANDNIQKSFYVSNNLTVPVRSIKRRGKQKLHPIVDKPVFGFD